ELLKSQHAMTVEQLAVSSARYDAGQASLADVLEPQTKRDMLAAKIAMAINEVDLKLAALESASGLHASALGTPPALDDLTEDLPPIQTWFRLMADLHPDLCRLRSTMRISRLDIEKSRAEYKPTVDAVFNYGLSDNPKGVSDSPADRRIRS